MFSSLNYEKKYLKYKSKYQILKNQFGSTKNILSGGECNPLPDLDDDDVISGENLLDLYPAERITIQNKCYAVKDLYTWIIEKNKNILPGLMTTISDIERENLIRAYRAIRNRR